MRLYRASRRELFERLDQPALRPLPAEPFVYGEWKVARVNIDYHVELHRHYYSVPLRPRPRGRRRPRHGRHRGDLPSRPAGRAHRARRHAAAGTRPSPPTCPRPISATSSGRPRASRTGPRTIGPQTAALVAAILADRPHPEQGYRSCLGLLRLGRRYGDGRLEAASARALAVGARSYRHVDSILKHGLDRLAAPRARRRHSLSLPSTNTSGAGTTTSEGEVC